MLDNLPWKDERWPSSIRRALELFQTQRWGNFWEWGGAHMGLSKRTDTIWNWTELTGCWTYCAFDSCLGLDSCHQFLDLGWVACDVLHLHIHLPTNIKHYSLLSEVKPKHRVTGRTKQVLSQTVRWLFVRWKSYRAASVYFHVWHKMNWAL